MNTDAFTIKSILKREDPNLYLHLEHIIGEIDHLMLVLLKWMVTLFSQSFSLSIFSHLMDLMLCFGNWTNIMIATVLLCDNRDSFLMANNMGDVNSIIERIPDKYFHNEVILKRVYDLCLTVNSYSC